MDRVHTESELEKPEAVLGQNIIMLAQYPVRTRKLEREIVLVLVLSSH